jgi:AP2-associated kinase
MLKEHGTQRPSVFDILNLVHALRGSTSRFSYNIPAVAPLSPSLHRQPANPLDDVVSYRPKSSTGNGNMQPRQEVEPGGGLQARDRVLEAIAPMRRGRPQMASPAQTGASPAPTLMTANKSGTAKTLEGLTFSQTNNKSGSDPWAVSNAAYQSSSSNTKSNGFADSFDGTPSSAPRMPTLPPRPSISANVTSSSSRVPGVGASTYTKDAFAGLGLAFADTKASPTLGEARKMRTGLASMGSYSSTRDPTAGLNMNTSMNTPSSPRPRSTLAAPDMPGRQPTSPKPRPTSGLGPPSPKPHGRSAPPSTDLTPEERFPSLEDLDRKYGSASSRASNAASIKTEPQTSHSRVATGTAMRDTPSWMTDYHTTSLNDAKALPQGDYLSHPARDRPQLSRKHRSSTNTRSTTMDKSDSSTPSGNSGANSTILSPDSITSARAPSPSRAPPQDWLTGDDDSPLNMLDVRAANNGTPQPPGTPVLRESPSKRASYIQDSGIKFQSPKHASPQQVGTREPASTSSISTGPTLGSRFTTVSNPASGHGSSTADRKPTNFGTTSNWTPTSPSKDAKSRQLSKQSSDSSDDGPEDAGRFGRPLPGLQTNAARSTGGHGGGKQSSVHELADRYGGLGVPTSPSKAVTGAGVQRRRSAVYPSMSATGRTSPSKTKKYTPQPITNVGRSTSPTKRPPSAQHRKQPSVTHTYVSPSPRTVASPSSATRARPQSMFMHPMSTSKSAEANLSLGQPTTVATPVSTHKVMNPGLVAPPDTRHKAQRRSSISDMVQMYESIASPGPVAAPKAMPPPVANKPAGLRVGTNTYQPPPSAPSPSPSLSSIAARFPALSPNTSPVLSRAELSKGSQPQISQNANGRTSPMLMRRASPLLGTPAPEPTWTGNTPVLAAPKPMSNDLMPPMSRPSAVARSSSGGEGENDNRSPSPSKPYQGVGKLIDRWQRNIADANPTIAGGPRVMPTGVKPRGGSTGKR